MKFIRSVTSGIFAGLGAKMILGSSIALMQGYRSTFFAIAGLVIAADLVSQVLGEYLYPMLGATKGEGIAGGALTDLVLSPLVVLSGLYFLNPDVVREHWLTLACICVASQVASGYVSSMYLDTLIPSKYDF